MTSQALISEAREWLIDIYMLEDEDDITLMSDSSVWRAIDHAYDGGVIQFARDGGDGDEEGDWRVSTRERLAHPTTADIYQRLDVAHCGLCERWAVGNGLAWEIRPNSPLGRLELDVIGRHILATYPRGSRR